MARGGATRRALLSTAIATVASILLPTTALALSCASPQFTLSEAYEAADSIVVGLITECKETGIRSVWSDGGSDCSFVSLEVLKEATPARDYGGTASSRDCGLSLYVGNQYLLFLDSDNQPLFYSAPLSGEGRPAELTGNYLRILRNFRDDASRELSEPWIAGEVEDSCFLSHQIDGHHIMFSRRKPDAPEWPRHDWTRETVDGQTVYRGRIPLEKTGSVPTVAEFVTTSDFSQYSPDMQLLQVNLREWHPVPLRSTTVSVGSEVWPLDRMETVFSRGDWQGKPAVDYRLFGEVTEKILSAMLRPSDVAVSASLIPAANADSEAPTAGIAPPGKLPPAVIRFETRSTELASAIGRYRECYGVREQP